MTRQVTSRNIAIFSLAVALQLFVPKALLAIEASAKTESGPYLVGFPVLLRVAVTEVDDQPTCKLIGELPDGVTLQQVRVTRAGTSELIINGRRYRGTSTFNFDFHVIAEKPGRYSIGPFEVSLNGESVKTMPLNYQFEEVKNDSDVSVEVEIPVTTAYVGQEVPIRIHWSYAGEDAIQNLTIASPLFDEFKFIDQPFGRGEEALTLTTKEGPVQVKAIRSNQRRDGQRVVVFTSERRMRLDKSGEFSFPIRSTMERVLSWRQGGFFSGRTASKVKPSKSDGPDIVLSVRPLPPNAPASFAGAVGTGFRFDVDVLGRTIVNLGDPVKLKLTIQGNGNIDEASLPDLTVDGGLDPTKFRLPSENLAGEVSANEKAFVTSIRVTDTSVDQIPALAYSWFDPIKEEYMTTRSEPKSLTVGKARIVSSDDVVVGNANRTSEADQEEIAEPAAGERLSSSSQAGADLSLVVDKSKLLANRRDRLRWLPYALYAVGIVIVGAALLQRRKQDIDPAIAEERIRLTRQHASLQEAVKIGNVESARQIVNALRSMVGNAAPEDKATIDDLVHQLESAIYAPDSTVFSLDESLKEQILKTSERVCRRKK